MASLQDLVSRQLRAKYTGILPMPRPSWLGRSRWNPTFCMSLPNDGRIIVIDLIPSANIPRSIYREEVQLLKQKHPLLRVIVCVLDTQLDFFPETEEFCRKIDCGLQTFIPELGLQTVVTTDLDRTDKIEAAIEAGWFPRHILDKAANLTKLAFHATIREFCREVVNLADNESAVNSLVNKTVDRLLELYPKCHANIASFMKLRHFEAIFQQVVPRETEHVLHSFRVFLAGCIIINRFYESFLSAHKRFCLGDKRKLSIEYCWLLTAIFHDIGHPKERSRQMLEDELEDEDIAVSVAGKDRRWNRENYINARRILASLGVFVASSPGDDDEWDYGVVPDDSDSVLAADWTNLYDRLSSHAVISALDMLASIIEQAGAVNERKNRPFVVTHATPAALAILLHDWHIWDNAKKWRLFPIDFGIIPMAALLIFIDTWDDFKRRGRESPISVESFSVRDSGVNVTVKWLKAEDYEKEKIKYTAFKRALKNRQFGMRIRVLVASEQ